MIRDLWGPSGLVLLAAILGALGVFWAAIQRNAAENQLRAKSDEIAGLNEKIAGLVSGGDSFCYLLIANLDPAQNVGMLTAVNKGKFPVFDV